MKMIKKLRYLFWVILFTVQVAYGQQGYLFSQYDLNLASVNPAYVGSNGLTATLLSRYQWVDLDGAPQTYGLIVDAPFAGSMGAGISVIYDKIGPFNNMIANLNYSYKYGFGSNKLAKRGRSRSKGFKRKSQTQSDYIALGLSLGVTNFNANMDLNIFQDNDPSFMNKLNSFIPNFGAGIVVHTTIFHAGFAASNILTQSFDKQNPTSLASTSMHLYGNIGFTLAISEALKITPYALLRYVNGAPLQLDASLKFNLLERIYFGATYRSLNQVSTQVQIVVKEGIKIAYAYDLTTSSLQRLRHHGSHEIGIQYTKIGTSKKRGRGSVGKYKLRR